MSLISIVVPIISRIEELVFLSRQLESLAHEITEHDFEFIFVGNGSNEESIRVLKELTLNDKRYRIVMLTRDFGTSATLLAGIMYASGDCLGFIADQNIDPSKVFRELINSWESGSLIVLGKWINPGIRSLSFRRLFQTEIAYARNLISNRILFQDISSLIIDKQVMYVLSQISEGYVDILDLLAWTGYQAHLVEYTIETQTGDGKRLSFQDRETSLEHIEESHSQSIFRISLILGVILIVLGVLFSVAIIRAQGYSQLVTTDWRILGSVIMFFLGLQMSFIVIFCAHLFRTFEEVQGRPAFVVDMVINPPISSSQEGREELQKMILSLEGIRKQRSAYATLTRKTSDSENSQD